MNIPFIAFASRALTSAERNYAPTEGECLAVKWAVDKFRYYLHGRPFTLRMNHQSLVWWDSAQYNNSKLERWALALQEYDFEVKYIKGETNCVADHLSRACSVVVAACAYVRCKVPMVARAQRQAMAALVPRYTAGAAWPEQAQRQSELDAVVCEVCAHHGGADNMAICSHCDKCFHLRCVVPAMSTVPSGDWVCPACDVFADNRVEELRDDDTVLQYHQGDPYVDNLLLAFIRSGHDVSLLEGLVPGGMARLRLKGLPFRVHSKVPDWLSVNKARRGQREQWLTCPPVEYRWDIIRCMHDALGHSGARQTAACLRQSIFWPGMAGDVSMFVKTCDSCQRRNLAIPQAPPLQQPVVHGPFEHVHIDLCGPFDTPVPDAHGKIVMPEKPLKARVVLMVDYFAKAAESAVVYEKTPAAVAKAFYYICRYFVPAYMTSDNGTEFEVEFVHLLARLGIEHVHTSAAHPASNGAVERVAKSFKSMFRAHVNEHPEHWLQSVPVVRMQYWSRLHAALGVGPHEMVFGRRPARILPFVEVCQAAAVSLPVVAVVPDGCPSPLMHITQLQAKLDQLDAEVFERIKAQFERNAAHWPTRLDNVRKRLQGQHLAVGDWVLEITPGPIPALLSGVKSPYLLVDFVGPGQQMAVLETGTTGFREKQRFQRHVRNLARYTAKHHLRAP